MELRELRSSMADAVGGISVVDCAGGAVDCNNGRGTGALIFGFVRTV